MSHVLVNIKHLPSVLYRAEQEPAMDRYAIDQRGVSAYALAVMAAKRGQWGMAATDLIACLRDSIKP